MTAEWAAKERPGTAAAPLDALAARWELTGTAMAGCAAAQRQAKHLTSRDDESNSMARAFYSLFRLRSTLLVWSSPSTVVKNCNYSA
jgi:hypothetical protein